MTCRDRDAKKCLFFTAKLPWRTSGLLVRILVLIAVVIADSAVTFAASDQNAASFVMPGCRGYLAKTQKNLFLNGLCVGMVDVLSTYSGRDVCHPANATTGQSVQVVVKYIDDRPARQNENFKQLALEALMAAWPCKD